MNRTHLAVLFLSAMVIGAASHRSLNADTEAVAHRSLLGKHTVSEEAIERQRILSELEEVHQLRERMLQEGVLCCLLFDVC